MLIRIEDWGLRIEGIRIGAAILAGGSATRLDGMAKGLLRLPNGLTIVEHLLAVLVQGDIEKVLLVANRPEDYQYLNRPTVKDKITGVGPLAGIEAALNYFKDKADAVLFLPCDLPRMDVIVINKLISAFFHSTIPATHVVFCKTQNKEEEQLHPLCAIVNTNLLPQITAMLNQNIHRIRTVWQKLNAKPILFLDSAPFININKPEDLAGFLRIS